MSRPGPSRSAFCIGNVVALKTCPSAQRTTVRSIKSLKSLPQEPRRPAALPTKATLRDQRDDSPGGTPASPGPSRHPATLRPNSVPPQADPMPRTHVDPRSGHRGSTMGYSERAFGHRLRGAGHPKLRGCSLMVEHQLPKLRARVRFSSPAPHNPQVGDPGVFCCPGARTAGRPEARGRKPASTERKIYVREMRNRCGVWRVFLDRPAERNCRPHKTDRTVLPSTSVAGVVARRFFSDG